MEWRAWIWMPWNGYTMWWWWCSGRKMAEKCYIQYRLSSVHLMACTVGQSQTILCIANRYRRYSIPFRFEFSYSASCVGYWFFFSKRFYVVFCSAMFRMIRENQHTFAFVLFAICSLFIRDEKKAQAEFMQSNYLFGSRSNMDKKKEWYEKWPTYSWSIFCNYVLWLGSKCVCVWERWNATISNFPLIGFCKCIYLVLHSDDLHITS